MINYLLDLRYGSRVLRRAPGFTAIAVIVLAVGIGAGSAIFSLVDAVLLRPLPFPNPDDLVMLWEHPPGYEHNRVAPLNFLDWSEQNRDFSSMAAIAGASRTLSTATGSAETIQGQSVTAAFFDLLGVKPVAGRLFAADDGRSKEEIVILSERIWRNRFGADPKLIGNAITLDNRPVTVIGIVPAGFQILWKSDLWTLFVPLRSPEQRRMHYLQVVARLKPGRTVEQARRGMDIVAADIARIAPETNKDWTVTIESLRQAIVGRELRVTSLVLAGVVGFILLMACANVANLLLARGAGRTREMAIRTSLGGSKLRIMRQLLTESALLCVLGGIAGVALAWIIVRLSPAFLPPDILPAAVIPAVDLRVIEFAAALTLGTGLLFGLAPAWHGAGIGLAEGLKAGSRTVNDRAGFFRAALAVVEIALAVMLVAGAGLLLRTLDALSNVDPGFHADQVLTMRIGLPVKRYPKMERVLAFYEAAEREMTAIPGARSVALGTSLPLDGYDIGQAFQIVGAPPIEEARRPAAHYQMVSTQYFSTLGIPLLRGRAFTEHDTPTSTPVCIVNEELVRRCLKGKEPVGARLSVDAMDPGGPKPVIREIVGVIRQVKVQGLGEPENAMEIYVPIAQNSWYWASIAVRTAGDPAKLAPAVSGAIARIDKDIPVTRIRTMQEVAAESISQPRFRAELLSSFASLALILAASGVFGLLAFSVARRTREFGIRFALGARRGAVLRLVLAGGLKIAAAGVTIGLVAAAALTRFLSSLLYEVKPLDLVTFLATPGLLLLVALLACIVPAWRAAGVTPSEALRQE